MARVPTETAAERISSENTSHRISHQIVFFNRDQIVSLDCLALNHKSLDSGERRYTSRTKKRRSDPALRAHRSWRGCRRRRPPSGSRAGTPPTEWTIKSIVFLSWNPIVFLNCIYLNHKSPDSGEHQHNQGPTQDDLIRIKPKLARVPTETAAERISSGNTSDRISHLHQGRG